ARRSLDVQPSAGLRKRIRRGQEYSLQPAAVDFYLREMQKLAPQNRDSDEPRSFLVLDPAQKRLPAAGPAKILVPAGLEQQMPPLSGRRALDHEGRGAPLNQGRALAVEDPDVRQLRDPLEIDHPPR